MDIFQRPADCWAAWKKCRRSVHILLLSGGLYRTLPFRKTSFFCLTDYPAEIPYLRSADRQLANGVQLVELWRTDVSFPPHSRALWSSTEQFRSFRPNLPVCVTSYSAKIAYFSSTDSELSNNIPLMELHRRKIVFFSTRPCFTVVEKSFLFFVPTLLKAVGFWYTAYPAEIAYLG